MNKNSKLLDLVLDNFWIKLSIYFIIILALWFLANIFETNKIIRGLIGLNFIFLTALLLSEDIRRINLKTVIIGLIIQFGLAFFLLLTSYGRIFFELANNAFLSLMGYSQKGIEFLFSSFKVGNIDDALVNFTFSILPTIVFFGALIYFLYYIRVMEFIIKGFSIIMVKFLGTSGAESLVSSSNIFVGQTEAPLIIKPFLSVLTRSEIFTIMSAGMATMAGGVMAAYVGMLVSYIPTIAGHLLTAVVLTVIASVYLSKIIIPEKEEPVTTGDIKIQIERPGTNVIDSIVLGARDGMFLAFNVGAMLLAFISLIALLNDLIFNLTSFLFNNISFLNSFRPFSFQDILSFICYPIAYLLGVPKHEAFVAAKFISEKIVINEFVAYSDFAKTLANNPTAISEQTRIILSYALGGFANFSSIGIQVGGIGALEPKIRPTIAQLGLRALIVGNLANFSSAVIAGMITTHAHF